DEATRALAEAHRYDPRRLRSLVHLADALRRARRFTEAAARYREAIRQRPGLARLHGSLGLSLWRLRRQSEAGAAWPGGPPPRPRSRPRARPHRAPPAV